MLGYIFSTPPYEAPLRGPRTPHSERRRIRRSGERSVGRIPGAAVRAGPAAHSRLGREAYAKRTPPAPSPFFLISFSCVCVCCFLFFVCFFFFFWGGGGGGGGQSCRSRAFVGIPSCLGVRCFLVSYGSKFTPEIGKPTFTHEELLNTLSPPSALRQ